VREADRIVEVAMAYTPTLPRDTVQLVQAPALPLAQRPEAVEEEAWARVFAERGIHDPAPSLEAAYAAMRTNASQKNCATYAQAAVAAGLEYYGDNGPDMGGAGWRQWAGNGDGAGDTMPVDGGHADLATAAESGQ
jgi:hypothetical protein